MAIRLASAIGQQREPIGILGGLDDAINKTGDAIQAANQRKAAEEAKKRDAALQAAINIDTDIDAMKEDNEVYKQTAKKLISDTFNLYANGASPMEIAAKKKEAEEILAPMKYRYEKDKQDYAKIQEFVGDKENQNKYDFSEAENFLLGKERREVPMPSQAPTDRTMPVNKEDSDITEVVDIQETPYWKKELGDRQKQAPSSAYSEFMSRVKDKTGNFSDASKGYFGKDYDPQKQYSKVFTTQNADGTAVQEVRLDTEEIARDKAKFLSSIGTELGDTKTQQYWRTLANKAGTAGKKAGLYGEKLNKFIEQSVLTQASLDFDNAVQQDIEKSKIAKVDNAKFREGKGINMTFTSGGGASKGSVTIEPVKDFTPLDKAGIKKAEKQTSELKNSIKKAEEIASKYKNNTSSPAYQNAKKSLDASRKALLDLEEENLKREEGFLMFSNKKAVDDAFIDINNDGKLMYRVIGFKPKSGGGYNVLGVERIKTDEGKVDKIKNMDLTESVYKKIIAENPDADKVMNELGVKPSAKTETTKATAKTYKIGNKEWSADKVEKAAKASGMSVDEYIKEIQK